MSGRARQALGTILAEVAERLIRIETAVSRTERKVDHAAASVARVEAVAVELSREVQGLRERLLEEADARKAVGTTVMEHEAELQVIKGGRGGP